MKFFAVKFGRFYGLFTKNWRNYNFRVYFVSFIGKNSEAKILSKSLEFNGKFRVFEIRRKTAFRTTQIRKYYKFQIVTENKNTI